MTVPFPLDKDISTLNLPGGTEILSISQPEISGNPSREVQSALTEPIGSPPLDKIIQLTSEKTGKPSYLLTACIVISDNTRPVPYRGESGILLPLIEILLKCGVKRTNILILIATGTHRELEEQEISAMLDEKAISCGVRVVNHDCVTHERLRNLGKTGRGTDIFVDTLYIDSDIKILTGLVESHFMAGVSGGRKSICPGLVGEESTNIFHGPEMMAHKNTQALRLEGNPCHEESLEVAKAAGADFIVNVTLDAGFRLTGIFAGDLEEAHRAAVKHLRSYIVIPVDKTYDIVVTHAGYVGINHYQAAKAGVEASRIVKSGGYVVMGADNTDIDPVGGSNYRTALKVLTENGPEAFERIIRSTDWKFVPEQWQVQMWGRLFSKIPVNHFCYFSPQFGMSEYDFCPCESITKLTGTVDLSISEQLSRAVSILADRIRLTGREPEIAWMSDGPYGICEY